MKRTKFKKKAEPPNEYAGLQAFGGFMPFPPDDCPAPRFMKDENGVKWVDMTFCVNYCGERKNYCKDRKQYNKYLKTNGGSTNEKETK